MNNIYIKVNNNIPKDIIDVNDLQMSNLFNFDHTTSLEVFDQIRVLNIYFTSSEGHPLYYDNVNDKLWDCIFAFFKEYIKIYNSYFFEMGSIDVKNRIRSYKGLYYKTGIDYIVQKEYMIKDPYSIIAAFVNININNIKFSLFRNFEQSFIYVNNSSMEFHADELLDKIMNNFRVDKDFIDYTKVLGCLLNESIQICRLVSDDRIYYKFQIFCILDDLQSITDNIKLILEGKKFSYVVVDDPLWDPWCINTDKFKENDCSPNLEI